MGLAVSLWRRQESASGEAAFREVVGSCESVLIQVKTETFQLFRYCKSKILRRFLGGGLSALSGQVVLYFLPDLSKRMGLARQTLPHVVIGHIDIGTVDYDSCHDCHRPHQARVQYEAMNIG